MRTLIILLALIFFGNVASAGAQTDESASG